MLPRAVFSYITRSGALYNLPANYVNPSYNHTN